MYSKIALVLIAAVGSAALAASAQTPNPSNGDMSPRLFRTPGDAGKNSGGGGGGFVVSPRGGGYSFPNAFGGSPHINQMFVGEEAGFARETDQLIHQLGEAKSDSDREKLKTKLGEVLEKQFEQRQKRHQGEIADLEAQVKKLKDLVEKRQENRREIIARRLEQVVRESQGLGW